MLNVLNDLCDSPILLAGFRRGDLKDLRGCTLLISEPNLDNRTAALLGNLTNRNFLLVEERFISSAMQVRRRFTSARIQRSKKSRTGFMFMRQLHLPITRWLIGRGGKRLMVSGNVYLPIAPSI